MREEKLALAREEKAAKEEAEKAEEARKLERKVSFLFPFVQ